MCADTHQAQQPGATGWKNPMEIEVSGNLPLPCGKSGSLPGHRWKSSLLSHPFCQQLWLQQSSTCFLLPSGAVSNYANLVAYFQGSPHPEMRNIFCFFSVSRHFQILLIETRLTFNANTFLHNALKVCKATTGLRDRDRKGKERKAAHPICATTQCKAAAVPWQPTCCWFSSYLIESSGFLNDLTVHCTERPPA